MTGIISPSPRERVPVNSADSRDIHSGVRRGSVAKGSLYHYNTSVITGEQCKMTGMIRPSPRERVPVNFADSSDIHSGVRRGSVAHGSFYHYNTSGFTGAQ